MNNITRILPTNQAFSKNNYSQYEWARDPGAFFSQWRHKGLGYVLNYLAALGNSFTQIYPTQSRIGEHADMTRVHTNRLIQRLEQEGIITKQYRYRQSCIYTLHPLFDYVPFRRKLQELMPSFWYLPLSLLFALHGSKAPTTRDYVTQISYQRYVYKSLIKKTVDGGGVCTDTSLIKHPNRKKTYALYWNYYERKQMTDEAVERLFSRPLREAYEVLHLTTAGMLWLSSYPDEAITHALERYNNNTVIIHKPYQWFDRLCKTYCASYGITPDFSYAKFLSDRLMVPLLGVPYVSKEGKKMKYPQVRAQPDTKTHSAAPKNFKKNNHKNHKREYAPPLTSRVYQPTAPKHPCAAWRETTADEREIWEEKMKSISHEGALFLEKCGITIPSAPTSFKGSCNGGIRRVAKPRYTQKVDVYKDKQKHIDFEGI